MLFKKESIAMEKWQIDLLTSQNFDLYKEHACKMDSDGNNVTHYAAHTGNVGLIQQLKEWNASWFAKQIKEGSNIVIYAIGSKNKKMLDFFYRYDKSLFNDDERFINALILLGWSDGIKWFGRHTPTLFIGSSRSRLDSSRLGLLLTCIEVNILDWFVINSPNVIQQKHVGYGMPVLLIEAFALARIDILRWIEKNENQLKLLRIAKEHSRILYAKAWASGSLDAIKFLHHYFGSTSLVLDASEWIGYALCSDVCAQINHALSFFPEKTEIQIDAVLDINSEQMIAARAVTLNKLLDCNFTLTHFSQKYNRPYTEIFKPEITKKLARNRVWPQNYALNMKKALVFYAAFAPSYPKDVLILTGCYLLLMSVPHPDELCWKGFFSHNDRFLLPEQQKPRVFSVFDDDPVIKH